jgi:hypothetical protein
MILMLLLGVFLPCYLYDEDLGLEKFKDFYCFFLWCWAGVGEGKWVKVDTNEMIV